MIVMIDNYDSFTYNLVQYIRELAGDEEVRVVRNDGAEPAEVLGWSPRAIVVSPGPGTPETAGMCVELIRRDVTVPLFGVCLGHQALAVAHGGVVGLAPEPRHGKVSQVRHDGCALFEGVPDPFTATRYHSLVAGRESLPESLAVSAWTEDGLVMALSHRTRPQWGVQFHPESYLTQSGKWILGNFLRLAGLAPALGEADETRVVGAGR
ncbi:MAG: aminodeoxychorismate/anthranilate synthase component II [Acidobacteriota bacterium]